MLASVAYVSRAITPLSERREVSQMKGIQASRDAVERNNAQIVRRYFDQVWNRGDLDAVERFFGDEFTNFSHRSPDARALIAKIVTIWRTAFPDLRFEIEDEVVRGDAVGASDHVQRHTRGNARASSHRGAARDQSLLQGRSHAHQPRA